MNNAAALNAPGVAEADPPPPVETFCVRSEAFAEDLLDDEESGTPAARLTAGWLYAAPLSAALVGTVLSLLQQAA